MSNPQEANTSPRCTLITPEGCPNRKGPNEENENTPLIIQPYGNVLVNNRPTISWVAVPGATSYTVQVKSYNVNWVKRVNDTTLLYPPEKEGLHYGSASKIIVIANKDDSAMSADTLVAHLLPEPEVTRINQALEAVNSLNLPPDEVFVDLDVIYMSEGVLNETIETLKAQVAAGSQNPTLYRILGDRYVEGWLPQQASRAYSKAVGLAAVQGKSDEEAIAKERLKLLNSAIGR
ncbi:hypothetical protein H6G76_36315 [Nostoc sp. FACHB-152]|uniref:hypothetical protein n=1 Tax=unclassified Nostoc TaxID=2593658 RepID=UPI001684807E|nr:MULTISPECIES: hypothetical protein [unclassified Nostoc]MBD2452467.1 hypothetical protein [Nostoc sp. FACHB-152]MBD2473394.1 hypothetical protein [Nostoc sp. FACHB-145]